MIEYAFPKGYATQNDDNRGMTLRDYIAIQAMNGYISAQVAGSCDKVAEWSYDYADAMLKAREK